MATLFAGLDVSTQSCKLVVIDTESGDTAFIASVSYDTDLPHYNTENGVIRGLGEGVSESDPNMWLEAVNIAFVKMKQAGFPVGEIRCISVSGQQHGLVALTEEGVLARPTSKLWNDFSTSEECRLLTERAGGSKTMIEEVGNTQRTGYTAAKIFHMVRHEPELYRKARTLFLVHNFINWYLTGGVSVMEPGDTSGTALWNPKTRSWSHKVIEVIDPGLADKLPEVKSSTLPIGKVAAHLVTHFGFSPECLVDAGCGDNMYGAIGTGNVRPGIVTISLGTSGTAYSFMTEPYIDETGEIAAFCDSTGNYLPLLCVSNLANGYTALLQQYDISHDEFSDIIERTKPGNGGRLLLPWYKGERTPDLPLATPLYFGFMLDDFTVEHLCRAVLEGHVLNLYDGFRRLPIEVSEIRLTGGLSQSVVWRRAIADIFDAETVPVRGEGAALGAALHAAWVWYLKNEKRKTLEEVNEPFIRLDEKAREKPDKKNAEIYKKQHRVFHALSCRVRGLEGEDPFALRTSL